MTVLLLHSALCQGVCVCVCVQCRLVPLSLSPCVCLSACVSCSALLSHFSLECNILIKNMLIPLSTCNSARNWVGGRTEFTQSRKDRGEDGRSRNAEGLHGVERDLVEGDAKGPA